MKDFMYNFRTQNQVQYENEWMQNRMEMKNTIFHASYNKALNKNCYESSLATSRVVCLCIQSEL